MKCFLSLLLVAFLPHLSKAKSAAAHTHGAAEVSIAIETGAAKALVTIEASADSILGTERPARTAAEKKSRSANLARLEAALPLMIRFEQTLGCEWKTLSLRVHEHHKHADIEGEFEVACKKALADSALNLSLPSAFPGLRNLKLQILSANQQTALTLNSEKSSDRLLLKEK